MSRETQCSENQICAEWRSVFLDFTDKNVCYIKLAAHCCMHVQYDYILHKFHIFYPVWWTRTRDFEQFFVERKVSWTIVYAQICIRQQDPSSLK
jgi:hypothetical protein